MSNAMKKSHIFTPGSTADTLRSIYDTFFEDRVTVYAAQASFFVVISAVPFFSLLFAILGIFMPADVTVLFRSVRDLVPTPLLNAIAELITELRDIPSLSLLSLSAFTTLWSASRGISAIRNGLRTVYGIPRKRGFFRNRLASLIYTLAFIVMVLAVVVILLFGDFLYGMLTEKLRLSSTLLDAAFRFRTPIFIVLISLVFNTMYYAIARRNEQLRKNFFRHLPGALLAAIGWNVFSSLYSLYITHFPSSLSLYGGLTAICLIMLWLYFCMIILLGGAEVNKILFLKINNRI
ncbi:MAG: YihY/virulence factor BrkB family protein [Ruminococcaceae bacterium]|nr:YihY/virulence factor BrkB family protein [Oscillospiraceae bacterium]